MLNGENETIAIIDSGIGGVAVLRELIAKFKVGNFIYFADNLFMPYGNKNKFWLTKRVKSIIKFLQEQYYVKHIIIACNTASTCINCKDFERVTTMVFDKSRTYFATYLTKKNLKGFNVVADRTLAKEIEKYIFDRKKLDIIIRSHIKTHKLHEYNEIVLGCTHYELVKDIFQKYCSNSKVINNSEFILNNFNIEQKTKELNVIIMLSKKDKSFEEKIRKLIKSGLN